MYSRHRDVIGPAELALRPADRDYKGQSLTPRRSFHSHPDQTSSQSHLQYAYSIRSEVALEPRVTSNTMSFVSNME